MRFNLDSRYIQTVMNTVLRENDDNNKRKLGLSGSQIGKCIREVIMRLRSFRSTPHTDEDLRTFAVGYLHEYFVRDMLIQKKLLTKYQVPLEYRDVEGIVVPGTLDYIIWNDELKSNQLADCKSQKEGADKWLKIRKEFIKLDHLYQQTTYFFSVFPTYKNIEECISDPVKEWIFKEKLGGIPIKDYFKLYPLVKLIYITKGNTMIYEPEFNPNEFKPTLDIRVNEFKTALISKELPKELEFEKPESCYPCYTTQNFVNDKKKKAQKVKIWCQYIGNCPKVLEGLKQANELADKFNKDNK